MSLTLKQKELMRDAFEGKDDDLGARWRDLVCALRDEIRGLESRLGGADIALKAYEATLQQIPPYAEGSDLELITAWIDKAKDLFETLATIRLAMTAELKPKTTRRKRASVEEKDSEETDQASP